MATITVDTSGLVDGTQADAADVSIPIGNLKTAVENILNGVQAFDQVNLGSSSTLTLASDTVTVTKSFHLIDTEGAASTDNLATINGGSAGDILVFAAANSSRDVVVKHGTGNIKIDSEADVTLTTADMIIIAVYNGTNWLAKGIGGGSLSSPPPIGNVAPNTVAATTLTATTGNITTVNGIVRTTASGTGNSGLRLPGGTAPTSPSDGDLWNDNTTYTPKFRANLLTGSIPLTLYSSSAAKVFDSTTTETDMIPTGVGSRVMPANSMKAGNVFRLKASGVLLYTGTPTFTFKLRIASTNFGSIVFTMPASPAFYPFTMECLAFVYTDGASGLTRTQGVWFQPSGSAPIVRDIYPAGGYVSLDTTVQQTWEMTGQWSASSASNQSITWAFLLEKLV